MNEWINDIVIGTIDTYGTSDPIALCDSLGIGRKRLSRDAILLDGQNSVYMRNFCGKEWILYAGGLRYKRLKFYLLHELGHAILHPNMMCSRFTNGGKMERQANYFAVKMIMHDCRLDNFETIERFALSNDIPAEVLIDVI